MDEEEARFQQLSRQGFIEGPEWLELFDYLFRKYQPFLKAYIRQRLSGQRMLEPEFEEDLIQDVYVEAMVSLQRRPQGFTLNFRSWLSILLQHCWQRLYFNKPLRVIVDFYQPAPAGRPGPVICLPLAMHVRNFNEI